MNTSLSKKIFAVMRKVTRIILIPFFFLFGIQTTFSQSLLSKSVSLDVTRHRLDHVLELLSNKGNFYFSYNSGILKKDSLVSLSVRNKSVKEVLEQLFNPTFEFRESGNYIIIRRAPLRMVLVTKKATEEDRVYSVSGYVYDEESGSAIHAASVYEKRLLSSSLTNMDGFFRIRLKSSKASTAVLTISKELYEDTSVVIQPRHNQELNITLIPIEPAGSRTIIRPEDYLVNDTLREKVVVGELIQKTIPEIPTVIKVEKTGMGKFLLSTQQKFQSLNLKKFFTTRPFQFSFVPGLGSHGKMSSQVVNNFSLNALGGYTAGTNGLEIGGLFNINKKDVRYVQVGGLFNAVGGEVHGLQIGGINNMVLSSVWALQAAGINNVVRGNVNGFQLAGIYNHVTDSVRGVQVGGIANFSHKKVSGVQIAGIMNFSNRETDGVQLSGVFNYSKRLRGVQIGLINIADTSEGYSIGLINIILKGYHQLSFSTNEILDVNASFKTGNAKLYSILQAGMSRDQEAKAYSFGYGLGSEWRLNKKKSLVLNPEIISQYLYLGSWNYTNILNRLQVLLTFKLNKYIGLSAGPAFSMLLSDQESAITGYRFPVSSRKPFSMGEQMTGWFGWTAAINFF